MHAMDPVARCMALDAWSLLDAYLFTVLCALNLRRRDGMTGSGPAAGEDSRSFSLKPSPPAVGILMLIKLVARSQL
jgi:hypothetical protein